MYIVSYIEVFMYYVGRRFFHSWIIPEVKVKQREVSIEFPLITNQLCERYFRKFQQVPEGFTLTSIFRGKNETSDH